MVIIQLTDLHLPSHPNESIRGQDTYGALEALLPMVQNENPDLLVISGDIAADTPEPQCYHYLKRRLEHFPAPWVVLKGNHDRSSIFDEIFQDHYVGGFQYRQESKNTPLLFFDTSMQSLPEKDLQNLETYLLESDHPNYLFTHYPPLEVGNPLFDEQYPLLWRNEFFQTLSRTIHPLYIFFGHIHYEYQAQIGQLYCYAAPSSTLPILSGSSSFVLEKHTIYYRKIVISPNLFKTSVHRIFLPN